MDFCDFVAPTEDEQQMRATAVQGVSNVVKSIWPSSQVAGGIRSFSTMRLATGFLCISVSTPLSEAAGGEIHKLLVFYASLTTLKQPPVH